MSAEVIQAYQEPDEVVKTDVGYGGFKVGKGNKVLVLYSPDGQINQANCASCPLNYLALYDGRNPMRSLFESVFSKGCSGSISLHTLTNGNNNGDGAIFRLKRSSPSLPKGNCGFDPNQY